MTDDRIAGTAKNIGGKVQEGVGSVTGNASQQARGKLNQAEGSVQDMYGQAKDMAGDAADIASDAFYEAEDFVRDVIETRPYTVAVVALAIGFFLGRSSRSHY